jgi:hypothetical protein
MQRLFVLALLASSLSLGGSTPALADDAVNLGADAAAAARALLGVPKEAAEFNEKVEITDIAVIRSSRVGGPVTTKQYFFSGRKRLGVRTAPRQLLITETRSIRNGFQVEYDAQFLD